MSAREPMICTCNSVIQLPIKCGGLLAGNIFPQAAHFLYKKTAEAKNVIGLLALCNFDTKPYNF